jgi:hypothetical protein
MARRFAAQQLQLETVVPEPPPAQEKTRSPEPDEHQTRSHTSNGAGVVRAALRPSPDALLETPGALLTRSDLRRLGLERRAIDVVFRALPVVVLPGYSRPTIRAEEYFSARRAIHVSGRSSPPDGTGIMSVDG